ncbi:ModD protein [uncultured Campylobacter sp.]|uniref:ModD protein n=1 Tax=uncultured Campylobacter sp. TaxID=218934 RepID=UPI0028E47C21|nr:ModD protein [uncultured Campylobacter sp.]
MIKLSDAEILAYIGEDLPYFDLTTSLQGIQKSASLTILPREDVTVSCADVAARIAQLLGCEAQICVPNSAVAAAKEPIVKISGSYDDVHKAWKLAQICLEYACKIATYARAMNEAAKSVNPKCEILATRKSFPFAKKFCLKAVLEGGCGIHRLNLSESMLFFKNHIKAYDSYEEFLAEIPTFKTKAPERKIAVECENLDDCEALLKAGADVVQCDKFTSEAVKQAVDLRDKIAPNAALVASGGINLKNIKEFASAGADALVTSAMYTQGMADITAILEIV